MIENNNILNNPNVESINNSMAPTHQTESNVDVAVPNSNIIIQQNNLESNEIPVQVSNPENGETYSSGDLVFDEDIPIELEVATVEDNDFDTLNSDEKSNDSGNQNQVTLGSEQSGNITF